MHLYNIFAFLFLFFSFGPGLHLLEKLLELIGFNKWGFFCINALFAWNWYFFIYLTEIMKRVFNYVRDKLHVKWMLLGFDLIKLLSNLFLCGLFYIPNLSLTSLKIIWYILFRSLCFTLILFHSQLLLWCSQLRLFFISILPFLLSISNTGLRCMFSCWKFLLSGF